MKDLIKTIRAIGEENLGKEPYEKTQARLQTEQTTLQVEQVDAQEKQVDALQAIADALKQTNKVLGRINDEQERHTEIFKNIEKIHNARM